MISYHVIECDSPTLTVDQIGFHLLTALSRSKTEVRWNREGQVHVIPRFAIKNALGLSFQGHEQTFMWDQTVPLAGGDMKVTFNPRPTSG